MVALLPVGLLYYLAIIRAEEGALRHEFGDAFTAYAARTPRLVPAPHRFRPLAADARHSLREFLPREVNTLAALLWAAALVGRQYLGSPW